MNRPIILTSGEPAGIGPDIAIQWAQQQRLLAVVVLGDRGLFANRARQLGLPLVIDEYHPNTPVALHPGTLSLLHLPTTAPVEAGRLNRENAHYVIGMLQRAVTGTLSGEFSAIVTAPVHKGIINDAAIPFSGHTELLAELTATQTVVMMLATPSLRVALATTHLPLSQVPGAITEQGLEQTLTILDSELRSRFAIHKPHIVVCGLNPHAGEGGHLGDEEVRIIQPVIERLQGRGVNLSGPLPADSAFVAQRLARCDAVLAMYHDQGLPVLKHLGFGAAVNVTLGLPMVRTSVDHGTALELAGSGRATTGSLEYALQVGADMVNANHCH